MKELKKNFNMTFEKSSFNLLFIVSQNGQTPFKNLAANGARFLKCV